MLDQDVAGGLSSELFEENADAQAAKKPVLVIVHQVHSNPGHIGQWFVRNGHRLDIRRIYEGQTLPKTLTEHCGAVIFGGPQSANDDLHYIRREIDWIAVPLKEKMPFLGICLGGQMLARHLGSKVDCCSNGTVEIGYHPVAATAAGRALGPLPKLLFQWHREGFEVPRGGHLLATSNGHYPNQAFSFGPAAIGFQFHPEITFAQINRWSGGNPMRLLMRGARPRQEQMENHLTNGPEVHAWLDQFMRRWVVKGLDVS